MRPQILIPFDATEAMSVAEAARFAKTSNDTIRRWVQMHNLGRKIGGRWAVSRYALKMYVENDKPALRAFLGGDRKSDLVRPYLLVGNKAA